MRRYPQKKRREEERRKARVGGKDEEEGRGGTDKERRKGEGERRGGGREEGRCIIFIQILHKSRTLQNEDATAILQMTTFALFFSFYAKRPKGRKN